MTAAPVLAVENLDARYGGVHALRGVTLEVREREIVALIGANGAGKTTTLMSISQVLRPAAGSVRFLGREIVGMPPHAVVGAGLCQVPEGRRIFPRLTVRENLEMGAFLVRDRAAIARRMDEAFAIFPILGERGDQLGGTLSGGEQQMLAIARALMLKPRLLLLDEPSFGLAPLVVQEIFRILRRINSESRVSMLLVELNAALAFELADHAYVL